MQGQTETDAQTEQSSEIVCPFALKPEQGLEIWQLWAVRKNEELDKQGTKTLTPIGRESVQSDCCALLSNSRDRMTLRNKQIYSIVKTFSVPQVDRSCAFRWTCYPLLWLSWTWVCAWWQQRHEERTMRSLQPIFCIICSCACRRWVSSCSRTASRQEAFKLLHCLTCLFLW